jgi:hypothetical protein
MKRSIFTLLMIALTAALLFPGVAKAQNAATLTWSSSIYYYSPVDNDDGVLTVTYYSANPANPAKPSSEITIKAGGSGELYIGEVNVPRDADGFKGSAVLSSDVPIVAVYEQRPTGDPNYARLIYSAFSVTQGGQNVYIPALLNAAAGSTGYVSQVGIQNVSAGSLNATNNNAVTLHFYKPDGYPADPATYTIPEIAASNSYIFKPTDTQFSGLPADTSVWVEVNNNNNNPNDKVVVAAEDLQIKGRRAYAYEGVSKPSTTVFMPSMLCRTGRGAQTSLYYIQNTTDTDTTVKVDVYVENVAKSPFGSNPKTINLRARGKVIFSPCDIVGTAGKSGTAVIKSDNPLVPLAVIGKVQGSDGLMTSFSGVDSGSTRVVLPYMVWAANPLKGYQTSISIMNVSNEAGNATFTAKFLGNDGRKIDYPKVATLGTIPQYSKRTFTPSTAGALKTTDKSFRGALEINSDKPVVVIVRVERKVSGVAGYTYFGEDYLGIPYP